MSRQNIPFFADDMSKLARTLRRELAQFGATDGASDGGPGHVTLLNMLARSAGWRNFHHYRTLGEAREQLDRSPPAIARAEVDYVRLKRIARYFDAEDRLVRWPGKQGHRVSCLWVLWSWLAPRRVYTEAEINNALNAQHLFGDHALLRRDLCDLGLVTRTADGSEYRRVEQAPPAHALALIRHLEGRRAA